jgi:hypothetical protein
MTLALALPLDAAAQGRGRPKQPRPAAAGGSPSAPAPATTSASAGADTSVPVFRQFGTWLDDASAAAPGTGWMSIGAGYWRVPGGSQIDVPILGVAYGAASRVQLSATVPFYRASYLGATARGLDDVYLGAKFVAVDPARGDRNVGLAVSPVIEILGTGAVGRRVHWALPVSAEVRGGALRLYGSAGYFSRGAVFTGGALEVTAPAGTMFTAALTQSLSTSEVSPALPAPGRSRVDAMLSVAHPLTAAAAGYVSIGRSLTSIDSGGTTLAVTGGITVGF